MEHSVHCFCAQALSLSLFPFPSQFYRCFLKLFHCDHWIAAKGNTSMTSKTTVIQLTRRVYTVESTATRWPASSRTAPMPTYSSEMPRTANKSMPNLRSSST